MASFPECDRTESWTPPLCRYMTLSDGSPWEKTTSLRAYATIRFPRPVDSRNAFASNARGFFRAIADSHFGSLGPDSQRKRRGGDSSVVQDDAQQRAVDLEREVAVVFDEAESLEFIQKEIHTRARRPDHFRQRRLRHLRHHANRLVLFPIACEQKERAGQPLLARVEELIDQVLFDPDVARQHVGDEPVRHVVLAVQQPHHLLLVDEQDR